MKGRRKSKKRLELGEDRWEQYQIDRNKEKSLEYYYKKRLESKNGKGGILTFESRKIKNIKGLRSGMLVAIMPIKKDLKKSCILWECECDCGRKSIVRASKIIGGETKSCGCNGGGLHTIYYKDHPDQINSINKNDYGEIPQYYYEEIVKGAKKRKLDFLVDIKYLNKLFLDSSRKCSLSGLDIRFYDKVNRKNTTASLDRINSEKGYVEGNLQWVHRDVNRMKNHFEQNYFLDVCERIVNLKHIK